MQGMETNSNTFFSGERMNTKMLNRLSPIIAAKVFWVGSMAASWLLCSSLNEYPWMKIDVEAHSDAKAGATCTRLTKGRAKNSEKYLRSKGVKNPMGKPRGKCGVKRAIVIASSGGHAGAPAGCGVTTSTVTEPTDPCKMAVAERKANKKIAAALKSEVRFGGGSTAIKSSGERTLNKVAKILKEYPWMKINV